MSTGGVDEQTEATVTLGARRWAVIGGSGSLGSAPGWTRVLDVEADDALVFSAVESVPLLVPRITLNHYDWSRVHAGRWPDPTRFDQRFLDVAIEPYRRPGAEGWTVLRSAVMQGRSVLERSWIFREQEGIRLVRMRCPAEIFRDMEILADSIVATAPGISTSGLTHVIDYGPGGSQPLPTTVEISRTSLAKLLATAGSDALEPLEATAPERERLASLGILDRHGAVTATGRWWARTHIMAPRRWFLRAERGGAAVSTLDLAVAGNGVAVQVASGGSRWIGMIHRSRLPEYAARFVGVAPAPHVDLRVPVDPDLLRARLADAGTPLPEQGASPEFQALWQDHWTRWILAGRSDDPSPATSTGGQESVPPIRQFVGTTHHGHFRLSPDSVTSAGRPATLTLEPVPSSELFALFCRDMLGPGHVPTSEISA